VEIVTCPKSVPSLLHPRFIRPTNLSTIQPWFAILLSLEELITDSLSLKQSLSNARKDAQRAEEYAKEGDYGMDVIRSPRDTIGARARANGICITTGSIYSVSGYVWKEDIEHGIRQWILIACY